MDVVDGDGGEQQEHDAEDADLARCVESAVDAGEPAVAGQSVLVATMRRKRERDLALVLAFPSAL